MKGRKRRMPFHPCQTRPNQTRPNQTKCRNGCECVGGPWRGKEGGGGRVVVGREVLFSMAAAEAGGVKELRAAGTTARLSMIMMATYRALRAACGNIHSFIKIYMFLFVRLRCEAGRQAGKRVDAGREWEASDGLSGGSLRGDGGGGGTVDWMVGTDRLISEGEVDI